MCTWGFIQRHLFENLKNPKSTILFTWYCPPNSPGWRIKQNLPVYLASETNEEIQPICKIVDNKGFSGHLDHEEVLMYIQDLKDKNKLARNATIVLNHGWSKREEVKVDILEKILQTKRNVTVLIPELWDTVEIKC
jgi:metallo-beta-lactamase family protein